MKRQQLHSQPHQLERAANVDPNKVVAPPFGVRLRVVARQAPSSGLSCYGTQSDGKPPFIADLGQQYPCFWCLVPPDYSLAQCRALGPGLRRCTRGSLVTCSLMVGLKTGAPFVPSACTRSCPQAMQSGFAPNANNAFPRGLLPSSIPATRSTTRFSVAMFSGAPCGHGGHDVTLRIAPLSAASTVCGGTAC